MRYAHVIYYIAGDLITSIMRVALCQVKYDARRPAGPRTCADHRDESVSLSNAASSVQICVPHSASAFIVSQSHSAQRARRTRTVYCAGDLAVLPACAYVRSCVVPSRSRPVVLGSTDVALVDDSGRVGLEISSLSILLQLGHNAMSA